MAKFKDKPAVIVTADPTEHEVRVTKAGDMQISTGNHTAGMGDELFEAGETFKTSAFIGWDLQDRGLAEFTGKEPKRPRKAAEPEAEPEGAEA